jgi:hypothetical protein
VANPLRGDGRILQRHGYSLATFVGGSFGFCFAIIRSFERGFVFVAA